MLNKNQSNHRCPCRVVDAQRITPHMQRLTFHGAGLRDFPDEHPAQWVKVILPGRNGGVQSNRAYTIRRFVRSSGFMEIDFALHGDGGPLSNWAATAMIGEEIELAGPRPGHRIDFAVRQYLLIGDPTSLPAISAILEALPFSMDARVFVEVAGPEEEQALDSYAKTDICWLHSGLELPGTSGQLELTIQSMAPDLDDCQVWLAGESFMVRAIRTYLLTDRGLNPSRIDSKGYWKMGAADHRDGSGTT